MAQVRIVSTAVLGFLVAACGDGGGGLPAPVCGTFVSTPQPGSLTAISSTSPFAASCGGAQPGTLYLHAEVEPFAAANPLNPDNLIAVWQQDRWSNGGARGLLAAMSFDGGESWSYRQAPFSQCSCGTAANGGDYARATDPWVTFTPDGKAFWMAMSITDASSLSAMLVSRSLDGGGTWSDPVTLIRNGAGFFNDKNTITADPTDSNFVYAVWDRLEPRNPSDQNDDAGPAFFSRTTDGGDTWETALPIYDPGFGQTVGNFIAVLPDGTLVNLFTEIDYDTGDALLRVIRSNNRGLNWSAAVTIAELQSVGVTDPETGAPVRTGNEVVPAIAVSPGGRLAVVWGDARFSGYAHDGIALSTSDDGGDNWSEPIAINRSPLAQAFTPAVRYLTDGTLGVAYYDFRDNTPSASSLPTSYWLATSADGVTWNEQRVSDPFDLNLAPNALGLFLGDYMVLLADGAAFRPFFVKTNDSTANRTDLHSLRVEPAAAPIAKAFRPAPTAAAPPSVEARIRIRAAIQRALPNRRHDSDPLLAIPDRAVLP